MPPLAGETRAPPMSKSFFGSRKGAPVFVYPCAQFADSENFPVTRCSPVTRSSVK